MIRFMKLDGGVVVHAVRVHALAWKSACGNVKFDRSADGGYFGRVLISGSGWQPASFVDEPGAWVCRDCQRVMAREAATFAEWVTAGEAGT